MENIGSAFLVRETQDVELDGEIWGLEQRTVDGGSRRYGIAGADGQAEAERKANESRRVSAEAGRESSEAARAKAEKARAESFSAMEGRVGAARMAVGAVTVSDKASASIGGTAWDWRLDLGLPRGPQGPMGERGPAGTDISVGDGAPTGAARDGAVYIDSATGDLYTYAE